jgi:hypothetical protein
MVNKAMLTTTKALAWMFHNAVVLGPPCLTPSSSLVRNTNPVGRS